MKLINPKHLALTLSFLAAGVTSQPTSAVTTPAEQDKLRIHTSLPKKASDSLFSYTVEWRVDEGEMFRAVGLSFLNAAKIDSANPGIVAKKLVTAIKDGMVQLDPNWRGISASQTQDQPELTVSNKEGYSLTTVTVKDYTNQAMRYDMLDKSFNSEGVQIAIDLVLAADVEYLEKFSAKKGQNASQGAIEITIDGQKPVHIATDGKTTREIESEIAQQLTDSQVSELPLFPSLVGKDTRNNKPFDGSEVQLLNPVAKSITIDVTDPALGVLTKFKFKDENHSVKVFEPRFMLIFLALASVGAAGYFWYTNFRKQG